MLVKFAVKNFRNFGEWFEFDLSSPKQYEFNASALKDGVVNHAMIYGINGGGKSNLGLAMIDLTHHLLDDQQISPSLVGNYLNASSANTLAEFKYTFRFGDDVVLYEYGKENPNEMVYETVKVNGKQIISIQRDISNNAVFNVAGAEHLKTNLKDSKISIVKYLMSNTVLDDSRDNKALLSLLNFVKGMVFFRSINADRRGEYYGKQLGVDRLSELIIKNDAVDDFEQFLNEAGIECKLCLIPYLEDKVIGFDFGYRQLEFGSAASTGTIALGIFYYWWLRLRVGEIKFAYIDEFDAFYHHSLAKLIAQKVIEVDCQTIMTTHNTSVMSNDLLRPDCYFELDGTLTPLSSMTQKDLRKAHNIEKIYKGMTS